MYLLAEQAVPPWLAAVFLPALGASLIVWGMAAGKFWRGEPVVAYEPRRQAPWRGWHLLAVLMAYLCVWVVVVAAIRQLLGPELTRPPDVVDVEKETAAHLVVRLVAGSPWWMLLLAGFSAVLVAPVAEEFLFRVLLQGWLEAEQRRWRPKMPTLRRLLPGATGPILLSSLLFASQHFRVGEPPGHPQVYVALMLGSSVVTVVTAGIALVVVHLGAGATAADLGWAPRKLLSDAWLGLGTLLAVIVPVFAIQIALAWCLPATVAADPISLFFFAIALGILYHRTHRLAPPVVLHALLNATSLTLAWLTAKG